ncbi:MAG: SPASM domain-containing protein [Deltaproteobacteria bacterium]|nr:SPASM domain-containing protein [Deltaproteobacteria bacterium]
MKGDSRPMGSPVGRDILKRTGKRVLPPRLYDIAATWSSSREQGRLKLKALLLEYPVASLGPILPWLYPGFLSIALTTRCNLRCFICRRENHVGENLPFENLALLAPAIRHARTIDLTGWGECFVYPRFKDALRYIYSLNPRESLIQITTNGTLLTGEAAVLLGRGLRTLIISLNSANPETYNRDMKFGEFGSTLRHIREFMGALPVEGRGKVQLHFVAHAGNYLEIPDFVLLASELGIRTVTIGQYLVDLREHVPYALLSVREGYNGVVRRARELARNAGVDFHAPRFFEKSAVSPASECLDPVNACYVEVDGQVGPCCFCGSYRIGNVYKEGFQAVWFGREYRRLRRKRHLPACRVCTPHLPLDDPGAHCTAYFKEREGFPEGSTPERADKGGIDE